MKEGSLVVLRRPLKHVEINELLKYGIKSWPIKDEVYEVLLLRKPIQSVSWDTSIVLVEFEEYEKKGIDMSADLYMEVLPPSPNLIEELQPMEEELSI